MATDRPIRSSTTELLVQLAAECPKCRKREARRIARWRVDLYAKLDPEKVCETVVCKWCGAQYEVKASAYQGAA